MKIIFKCIAGSHLYGIANDDSDTDIRGICFPPENAVFGLTRFEQHEGSSSEDVFIYSVTKFISLALQNNPNILELLFVPDCNVLYKSQEFFDIERNRETLISKGLFTTHFGYARSQMHRLEHCHPEQMTSKRRENVEKYGYDTKAASHLFRLLEQCEELVINGRIAFPLANAWFLKDVRNGKYTISEIKEMADERFIDLARLESECTLPSKPDFDFWNNISVALHREHFCSQSHRSLV